MGGHTMNALLIRVQSRKVDSPYFPVALGYIASALLSDKHNVEILDIRIYDYSEEQVEDIIKKKHPDLFGISAMVTSYKYVKWLNFIIKKYHPNIPIVIGGTICEVDGLLLEKAYVDIVIIKEGENTIRELVKCLENSEPLENVRGIVFKKGKKIIRTPPRELIKDLNTISFPAYHLFPMERYLDNIFCKEQLGLSKRTMIVISSRGCPYHCTFCRRDKSFYRFRSSDNIIEEIKFLREKYNVVGFAFQDECMIVNRNRIVEFCNKLIEQKLEIKWSCLGRVDLVDEELLRLMKKAGCVWMGFGIETGSQKMLDVMKKNTTSEMAERSIRLVKKVGIKCGCTYMIGMPGETKETIQETVDFLIRNDQKLFEIGFATPYPGTELFEWAVKYKRITSVERFVEDLDRKDTRDLTINLTDMSDKELLWLKEDMIHQVMKVYLRRHKIEYIDSWITSARRMPRYIKEYGLKDALRRIIKRIELII